MDSWRARRDGHLGGIGGGGEMLNKSVMKAEPCVVFGEFWQPILERVREVEWERQWGARVWGEVNGRLVQAAKSVEEAVPFLARRLKAKRRSIRVKRCKSARVNRVLRRYGFYRVRLRSFETD